MPNQNDFSPYSPAEIRAFTPRVMRWGFGTVMAVIVFIAMLGLWRIELDHRAMNEIVANDQTAVKMLFRMQLSARDRILALLGAVHTEDPFVRDSGIQRFYGLGGDFVAARAQLAGLDLDGTARALLARQSEQVARIRPLLARVIEHLESGRRAEAQQLMLDRVVPAQNQMIETLTALQEHEILEMYKRVASVREAQKRAGLLFLLVGLAGVLLTWRILLQITRRMGGLIAHLLDASERLRESNLDLKFQKLALDEHNIVSISDVNGNIISVNDKFCEASQYSREELLGRNHRLLKSGRHSSAFYEDMWSTISTGKVWHGEICNRRKDGTFYWVASTILPFVDEDGLPSQYVSVRTDITAVKEAQRVLERSRDEMERLVQVRTIELAEREEMLRSITNAAQDAVVLIDHAGLITYWNPAAASMFGYTEAEAMGQNLHDLVVPERYLGQHRTGFARFIESGEGPLIGRVVAIQAKRRTGEEFPAEIAISAVRLRGQWGAVGIVRDATEHKQAEERLQLLATTDTLTGICNRRRFDEVLADEIRRAARFSSPLSLILFDIDHFKRINDTFGHQAGDQVLIELARVIGGAIRATDLFARWGGEEFMVLAPGCDLNAARLLAEKLRVLLENRRFANVGQVTCSFGVAAYVPGDDADSLMRSVDRCLYRAKAAGRNRVETHALSLTVAG